MDFSHEEVEILYFLWNEMFFIASMDDTCGCKCFMTLDFYFCYQPKLGKMAIIKSHYLKKGTIRF